MRRAVARAAAIFIWPAVLGACAAEQVSGPHIAPWDGGSLHDAATSDADAMTSMNGDLGMVESDLGFDDAFVPFDAEGMDAGSATDASMSLDAGTPTDADSVVDMGGVSDLGGGSDLGAPVDSGVLDLGAVDAGAVDSGVIDAGSSAPTSLVVVRVGTGSAARNSSSTAVFLDAFAFDGTPLSSTALPTATTPITMSGSATSEGCLAISSDGRFVTLAGYLAAPGVGSIAMTASASVPRVVARINTAFAIDVSTRTSNGFDGGNIRSAVTVDGTQLWMGGNGTAGVNGVLVEPFGATSSTQVVSTPDNIRCLGIFGGQLYATSGVAGYTAIQRIGSGVPSVGGTSAVSLPGMVTTGASPYGFVLLDRNAGVSGVDTAYVADDRAVASGGGVQKWTFDGSTWTLASTFTASGNANGCRGVTVVEGPSSVTVYATTADATTNQLVMWLDTGAGTPTSTLLATAAVNTIYRGVSVSPH